MIEKEESRIVLEARGLGYKFADGAWAFRSVDLKLGSGAITVLAGRNGAGKTMLAKTLAGIFTPTEGKVSVDGEELGSISGGVARRLCYVFQDARMQTVGDTVLDDALFGPTCIGILPGEARERALDAISRCGLSDRAERFVHELSGGELRRLAVAGALSMRPEAIILDEPFANLDPSGVRDILGLMKDLAAQSIAILVISHEIEKVLGLAERFLVMDAGRVVLSGSPEEVLRRGIEAYGLRDPFRPRSGVSELSWL
jgi:energy-coupling factor transporter ATP-binding protein EcfA2